MTFQVCLDSMFTGVACNLRLCSFWVYLNCSLVHFCLFVNQVFPITEHLGYLYDTGEGSR